MRRRLHLITGLILFAYVLTHFLNHMLGLVSLESLEAGRGVFNAFSRHLAASPRWDAADRIRLLWPWPPR